MTTEEISRCTQARLDLWRDKLTSADATPMLVVGVGHNASEGRWVVCQVEDLSKDELIATFLKLAELLAMT